jgi:hypothetical protein
MENDVKKLADSLEDADRQSEKETVVVTPVPKEKLDGAIRTYATDIANMMKKQKGSIIKIALAEQSRREKFQKTKDPTATKNIIVMMLGFILIVGGIMIFIYSIVNRDRPVSIVNSNTVFPSLFFTENQVQIDMTELNKSELYASIQAQVDNGTLVPETINNLFVSYNTPYGQVQVPATAFIQKLGIDLPDQLFQNLYPQFMLGAYSEQPTNNLFIVFRLKDFNEAFNGMRDWENTMLSDLVRLFRIDTSTDGKNIFSKNFETMTISNKEGRVLKNSSGKIILSYIFLDPNTIMITTKTDAVDEVVKRLSLQQTIK